jgi:probable rRNA maturation factor
MSLGTSSVVFHVPARGLSRRELRYFARQLQEDIVRGLPFSCLVTNDAELHALNKRFLKRDYPTDVLSFPSPATDGSVGDVAISWDRVKDQAAEYGHSTDQEIRILMLHGVLHLVGMDHEKDRGQMAQAEMVWRKRLKLPATVIERARL